MNKIEKLSTDPLYDRDLYLLTLAHHSDLRNDFKLSSPHYICFLAWDAKDRNVDEISALSAILIETGASYACFWGPNCERVHDVFDEIDINHNIDLAPNEKSIIMTTWHAKESLPRALFFFLNSTWPDEYFEESTKCSLAVVIGNEKWTKDVREALTKPRVYSDRVANNNR